MEGRVVWRLFPGVLFCDGICYCIKYQGVILSSIYVGALNMERMSTAIHEANLLARERQ
jgi:hypothetical protein